MCTVTYIPTSQAFFLSSNRDENRLRPAALPPAEHTVHGQRLLFPRDSQAGGTWIGVNANGYVMVLLNGAGEKHEPMPPYRRSRGLVFLDLLTSPVPAISFEEMDLRGIEPFTVVIAGNGGLHTARWNGRLATVRAENANAPHLWSSVTLYPAAIREKRERWFEEWIARNPRPGPEDIFDFHRFTGDGDPENDLLMARDNGIFTNSISVIEVSPELSVFHHLDLRTQTMFNDAFPFVKPVFRR